MPYLVRRSSSFKFRVPFSQIPEPSRADESSSRFPNRVRGFQISAFRFPKFPSPAGPMNRAQPHECRDRRTKKDIALARYRRRLRRRLRLCRARRRDMAHGL